MVASEAVSLERFSDLDHLLNKVILPESGVIIIAACIRVWVLLF